METIMLDFCSSNSINGYSFASSSIFSLEYLSFIQINLLIRLRSLQLITKEFNVVLNDSISDSVCITNKISELFLDICIFSIFSFG